MTLSLKSLLYMSVLAAFLGQACTQSNFTGSGSAKRASSDATKDGPDGGSDAPDGADADGKDAGDADADADGGDVDGKDADGKGGIDADTDNAGTGGDLGETGDCLAKKADSYNIMMIFDRSLSQIKTDPDLVRRDGALAFVDRVYQYVQSNPKARVYMSTLAFNEASVRGANGWQRLKDSSINAIKQDITTATSNPDGGTAYSPVLKDAANFFDQINKQTNADRTRNYVVFLTDGEPNALQGGGGVFGPGPGDVETAADIPAAVDNLVKNYGVAMVAIASGSSIAPIGEQTVQSMAQPTTGIKDKNHVGIYRRAQTPDDLKQVFDKLLSDIGTCN